MIRCNWRYALLMSIVCVTGTIHLSAADTKTAEPKAAKKAAPVKESATTKPVSREEDRKWLARHESINKRTEVAGDSKVLFVGDSITQGWEGNGSAAGEKYYGKRKVLNLGIGGDRTQHVLWRLDNGNIDGLTPSIAIVMIGTNNIGSDSPEDIVEGIVAIQEKLKEKLPRVEILQLAVFPRGEKPDDANRQQVEKVNELLKERSTGPRVKYLDIGKEFVQEDGTISKEIMPDFLHLSPKGYEIWAKSIEKDVAAIADAENPNLKKFNFRKNKK